MTWDADVICILRALRRRLHTALFLHRLAISALVTGAGLVIFGGVNHLIFHGRPLDAAVVAFAVICACGAALIGTLSGHRSLAEVAALIDARGRTSDRFVSALAFSKEGAGPGIGGMRELAERECRTFLMRADFRPLVPVRPPAIGAWLVVPLVALVFLHWKFGMDIAHRQADAAGAQAAVAETVHAFEQLAKQAQRADEQAKDPDLQRLAQGLRESAERLRSETQSDIALKSALRELSALEAVMKGLERQPSPQAEIQELARALAAVPGMKDVLDALDQNKLADAGKALDEAAKKAGETPDAPTDEQVRQALKQAADRLEQQRQLSEALQSLLDRARRQDGGKGLAAQAMQQLREMIRQMPQNGGNSPDGARQMTLQQLIAALQNLKFGDQQPPSGGMAPGRQPLTGPQIAMQSPALQKAAGQPESGDAREPSGRPGSEHDFGTTDSPFGAKDDAAANGAGKALKGRLGEGESLSMMLPAAGDTGRAARRYKELYEAMAPAAENAVEAENIPLGSRFFIRRYFESIRPRE